MTGKLETGLLAGCEVVPVVQRVTKIRAKWAFSGLTIGLLVGAWIAGGPDRYGEDDGVLGGIRGASRTMAKGGRHTAATFRDLIALQPTSVRNLGQSEQVQTRLWQDKRLDAKGIVVEIQREGTAVLGRLVPDPKNKELALSLARETRGASRVIDRLAVATAPRTIEATPAAPVPTGVATGDRFVR